MSTEDPTPMHVVDGPTAPPLFVTIPREEYDNIRREVTKAFDIHAMFRRLGPLLEDGEIDDDEMEELRRHWQHFVRDYGV